MLQILLIAYMLVSMAIIGLIMVQQGKGADMGASFGAGASQTLFGSAGSGNALTRTTSWLVAVFFALSFSLALVATQQTRTSNELDLLIPDMPAEASAESVIEPTVDTDLPQIDIETPEATAVGTPTGGAEGDVPEL
ncbi:MAG: preprotein translocase subunit SecG [Parahaliea sp.]